MTPEQKQREIERCRDLIRPATIPDDAAIEVNEMPAAPGLLKVTWRTDRSSGGFYVGINERDYAKYKSLMGEE